MHSLLGKLKLLTYVILMLFFFSIWYLTIFYHGWSTPMPKLSNQNTFLLITIVILELIYILGIHYWVSKLSNTHRKYYVNILLSLYTCLQLGFILLFPVNAYEDAVIVDRIARELLNGNYSSFSVGKYLGYYPNNIGITLFIAFLYSFLPKSIMTLRFINILFNTASVWLILKIYKEIYPEKTDRSYGILLLLVTFLPPVILNNFTYGDIYANTFCLAAMLTAIKFVKLQRLKYSYYTGVFLMLGNFMRSITLLFMIAIIVYWSLNLPIKNWVNLKTLFIGIICVVFAFNLPLKVFSVVGVRGGIIPEPIGLHSNPVWRWINIGYPENRLGYWDQGRNICIFVDRFKCDKKAASNYFRQEIVSNVKQTGALKVLKSYVKKTFWVWSEGTYTVNFYGLSQAVKTDKFALYKTPFIKYVRPTAKTFHQALDWFLHAYNWLLMGLCGLYIFFSVKNKDYRMELPIYIIFLYIGFYLLWEVKSRYLFGVYPILLIMSYESSERIYHYILGVKKEDL